MYLIDTNMLSELIKKNPNPNFMIRLPDHPCQCPFLGEYLHHGTKISATQTGKSGRPLDNDRAANPPKNSDPGLLIQGSPEGRGTHPSFIFGRTTHRDRRLHDSLDRLV